MARTVNTGFNVISVSIIVQPWRSALLPNRLGSQTEFIGRPTTQCFRRNGPTTVPATGTITTTTLGYNTSLFWPGNRTAVATVGLYDWAFGRDVRLGRPQHSCRQSGEWFLYANRGCIRVLKSSPRNLRIKTTHLTAGKNAVGAELTSRPKPSRKALQSDAVRLPAKKAGVVAQRRGRDRSVAGTVLTVPPEHCCCRPAR